MGMASIFDAHSFTLKPHAGSSSFRCFANLAVLQAQKPYKRRPTSMEADHPSV